jgi:ATP-binding cassette subfamily B protein/subfamily B ATP-binding cassette protein MsbA
MQLLDRAIRGLPVLAPMVSQQPAAKLIRQTARQQWRLIVVNLGSSLAEAFSEGAILAVIFLAVEVLSAAPGTPFNWASNPIVSHWPAATAWLNGLPATQVFMSLLVLALLLQALQSASRFFNLVSMRYFAARCRALVTARIHSQVLSWSYACASGYKVGDLADYAAQGPEALRIQVERSAALVVALLLSATYLIVLVGLSHWLLLAAALLALVIVLVQKRLLPRIRAGGQHVAQIQASISARVTEDFQGLRLLHTSGQLNRADARLQQRMADLEWGLRGQGRRISVVEPLAGFLPVLAMVLLAALSLVLFGGRGSGVLPSMVTFVLALQRLNMRLAGIANTLNDLADNAGRLERLNAVLSPEGKQFRRLGGTPFTVLEREIRFEGVGLRYAPELPPALSEVSFCLPKGQMLALVGPSGAGKSSIADLLTGLYAPTEGCILVDGVPLGKLELASWQQRLGVVSQDTFLFNATIAQNIAFGTPGATPEQITAACAAAQAAAFIEDLPQGYNTVVGERGYRLSGGQRQRLSLARAILRDPELLILDEATSALDSQSERLVQEAIERFERNHTVLVIAHRLSTVVNADKILVLCQGSVIEHGTHSILLTQQGVYSQLWRDQSQQDYKAAGPFNNSAV